MKRFLIIMLLAVSFTASAQVRWKMVAEYDLQATMLNMASGIADGQLAYCRDTKLYFRFDSAGVAWRPTESVKQFNSTVSVNLKAIGTTAVYTTNNYVPLVFYPSQVTLRVIESPSSVTVQPSYSIGTNAPNYDNIMSSSLLNTLLSSIGVNNGAQSAIAISYPIPANTTIYVKVNTPATATGNFKATLELQGGIK